MRHTTSSVSRARPRRSILALTAGLAALVIAASPAAAATYTVTMPGYDFSPGTLSIGRGDNVKWRNSGFTEHDVKASAPSGYFQSPGGAGGMDPGETYTYTFTSAGSFPYFCRIHGRSTMSGRINVDMGGSRLSDGRFKLIVGSSNLPSSSGYRRVIQVDTPGTGGWVDWKQTRNAVVYYDPGASGTYRFRSLVVKLSNGSRSGVSNIKSWTN